MSAPCRWCGVAKHRMPPWPADPPCWPTLNGYRGTHRYAVHHRRTDAELEDNLSWALTRMHDLVPRPHLVLTSSRDALVSLASRSQTWAGWQVVASLMPLARAS